MPADTTYKPLNYVFRSKGVIARPITDEAPPDTYLNLENAEERYENALSSRYGSVIINRDPNGTAGGTNYFLPNPIVSLSRLKYNAATWRYAADNTGLLFRRTGDTQGAYSQIASGLSGSPFSSVPNTCYASSIPYLFIADATKMLKDSGTGTPTRIGIFPPSQTANTTPYASKLMMIDNFLSASGYTTSNISSLAETAIGTTRTFSPSVVNNFIHYSTAAALNFSFNGAVAANIVNDAILFDIYGPPQASQISAVGVESPLANVPAIFQIGSVTGTVDANTTAAIGKTVNLDLSQNNQVTDDDLIVLTLAVSDPNAIQQVNVMFDVNSSGYTSSYFQKSISPAYYQPGVQNVNDPYQTVADQVYALASGLLGETVNSLPQQIQQLQPSVMSTGSGDPSLGEGSFMTIYMRRGDFLPVGSAGQQNEDWASVTGWQVEIVTNNNGTGSIDFGLNGLYLQWGAGPSSYGGVGYDYRYTYYNFNTGTESNGSPIQNFDEQYGYTASLSPLIVLRQPINVQGQYSADPQVTHVRIYRRGGTLSGEVLQQGQEQGGWLLVDQIPNVTGTGTFNYVDIIPDADLAESDLLVLDNDVPVTSTLQQPIYQTLTAPTTGPGTSPYSAFGPQAVMVTGTPTFVPNQIVDIGTPQNLEQVTVITGGVGTFTAVLRLTHAVGEPVQVFSIPGQPLDLVALAYGQMWWAGDPNNPHYLYFSKPGYPENCGPENYIQVSSPSDPIMGVIEFRGTLFVATLTTWYQIVNGDTPYPQTTGSKHGLVAKHGWTKTESAIWYQAIDGIREFRGSDGAYRSLEIEWLYRQIPQSFTPIELVNLNNIGTVTMAFQNNFVYAVYPGQDGNNYRLAWSTTYSRWRNDSVNATTIFFEEDRNTLLYTKFITAGAQSGYAVVQDRINDYDDGGWVSGALVETPIAVDIQLPYQDVGSPHFPKQWNVAELDINTQGQDVTVILNVDDGAQVLNLGTYSSTIRTKIQIPINAGFGVEGYRISPELQMEVTEAPVIYQMDIYNAVLAAYRGSYDSYWIKLGTDESKLIKEMYLDYTSTAAISFAVYFDGGTTPYFTFTAPANPTRSSVPYRQRMPSIKLRQWRCVATSTKPFQYWNAPALLWKACLVGGGYATASLQT